MRSHPNTRRVPFLALLLTCFFALLIGAHADPPETPPPAQTPPAQTPPTTPPPPAEAPQRREEEANPPPASANLGTRVSAMLSAMRGQGAAVTQLAERDATIQRLTVELTNARQQLGTANSELTRHRTELQQIESAMRGLETERADVTTTVAQLGFPAAQLPAVASIEQVEDGSPAGCYAKLEQLRKTDPKAARAYSLKNQAALRKYADSQPQWQD